MNTNGMLNKVMGIDFNEIPEVQEDHRHFADLCVRREAELEEGRQRIIKMQKLNIILLGIVLILTTITTILRFSTSIESETIKTEQVTEQNESIVVEKGVPLELVKPGLYRILITEE